MKRTVIFLLIFACISVTCNRSNRVIKSNLAYVYYDDPTIVHPQFKVFHKNDSVTTIYILVNASEILYSRNNPERDFRSLLTFRLGIYELGNDKKLIDSGSVRMIDRSGIEDDKYLIGHMDIKIPKGKYFAEVTLDDVYRMQYIQDIVILDKSNPAGSQYYKLLDQNGQLIFDNCFEPGTEITVQSSDQEKSTLIMKYYNSDGSLPAPPFAVENLTGFNFEADSTDDISSEGNGMFKIRLDRRGLYHFQSNAEDREGLTLMAWDTHFPYIKTFDAMMKPVRYITTKQEYQTMLQEANAKKSIDEFWYGIAGNAERARDIIKAFYTRVEVANKKFTSYYPGWKSDRGLIYIIYGPPQVVFKSPHYEKWTYNEKNNTLTEEFTFYRVETPLSENEYFLSRSANAKGSWYRAIDNWRQGRVF